MPGESVERETLAFNLRRSFGTLVIQGSKAAAVSRSTRQFFGLQPIGLNVIRAGSHRFMLGRCLTLQAQKINDGPSCLTDDQGQFFISPWFNMSLLYRA